MNMLESLRRGALAGAAGTTALNAATYLDMSLRGRPASTTPETSVKRLAEKAGLEVPGEGDTKDNRLSGLGALTGLATGVSVGVLYGLLRSTGIRPGFVPAAGATTLAALIAANLPMMRLGLTDPRQWSGADWLADLVPHVAYGTVTVLAYEQT